MFRATVIALATTILLGGATPTERRGEALYSEGNYQEAAAQLQQEVSQQPRSARLHTNLACSLYHLGRYDDAIKEFQTALQFEDDDTRKARIHYNIGNSYYSKQQKEPAIESYKTALKLNPDDRYAKYNLEIALKRTPPPPPQPPNRPNSQSPNGGGNNDDPDQPPQNSPDKSPQSSSSSKMTEEEAERILEALRQTERGPSYQRDKERSDETMIKRDW